MMLTLLLIFCTISSICYGHPVINIAHGVESDGLHLSNISIFKPIDPLTISLHFTSTVSVFVNYQITVGGTTYTVLD